MQDKANIFDRFCVKYKWPRYCTNRKTSGEASPIAAGPRESFLFLRVDKWHRGSSRGNWEVTVTDKEHNYHTMMKEPWRARVAPLITVLFPPASNVRKNTRWQVCKRASTKLLSGKINGGWCGPHSDLRGQLVTAPRRCWGQQCGGRESVRDTPMLHPHLWRNGIRSGSVLSDGWPLSGRRPPSNFSPVLIKFRSRWSSECSVATSYFKYAPRCRTYMYHNGMKAVTSVSSIEHI